MNPNIIYEMVCPCGYQRIYAKHWQAEMSAEAHNRDNFCGQAKAEVFEYVDAVIEDHKIKKG